MYLVDSHCHLDLLDLEPFNGQLSRLLEEAKLVGVQHFLCVCITLRDFPTMLQIAKTDAAVSVSVGLHPNELDIDKEPDANDLILLGQDPKVVAIGETGLDYYRSQGDTEWQRARFRQHIQAARTLHKPLIVHSRQAKADTLRILKEESANTVGGVLHCFTEDWEMAKQALDLGFYISFSGIVTFQNAKTLQEVAKQIPLDKLLIETDSPYLAPHPYRGQSNQPAYVRQVAEFLADLRGIKLTELADATTHNFFNLFKLARRSE